MLETTERHPNFYTVTCPSNNLLLNYAYNHSCGWLYRIFAHFNNCYLFLLYMLGHAQEESKKQELDTGNKVCCGSIYHSILSLVQLLFSKNIKNYHCTITKERNHWTKNKIDHTTKYPWGWNMNTRWSTAHVPRTFKIIIFLIDYFRSTLLLSLKTCLWLYLMEITTRFRELWGSKWS